MKNNTKNIQKGITAILFAVIMIASAFAVVPMVKAGEETIIIEPDPIEGEIPEEEILPEPEPIEGDQTSWTLLKPFYKGSVDKIVIDADEDLYSLAGGVWKSTDGGINWSSAQGNLPTRGVSPIAADPMRAGVLYVGTDKGLFKTVDGGLTWFPRGNGLPIYRVQHIVIDPQAPDTVYVGTSNGIYKSTNGGANWTAKNSGLELTGWAGGHYNIAGLAIDPVDSSRLYANTWRSYFHISTDGGESWTAVLGVWSYGIAVSESNPNVLYMSSRYGWSPDIPDYYLIRSTDSGESWHGVNSPCAYRSSGLAIDPTNVNVVYASMGSYGLYKSTDGSASWTRVLYPPGIGDVYRTTIDSANSSIIYAATAQGVYKSVDVGTTWEERNEGIASAYIPDIDVNRADPSRVYAVVRHEGVLRSDNAGETWAGAGFQGMSIGSVASHPTDPDTLLVGGWDPATKKQIWKSTDGGTTWHATVWNLRLYGAHHLAFHPLDPSRAFGSTSDVAGGIAMSTDSGESWLNPQYNYIYPKEYAFHPTDPDRIWVGYHRYWGKPVNRMGIAYSTNRGLSWSRVEFGYGGLNSLVIDPDNPSILYGACGGGVWEGVDYSGVWKSTDSGFTWTKKNTGLLSTSVRQIVLDNTTGTLYVATPAGVFRSEDGAENWSSISPVLELLHQSVRSLALAPNSTRLYVGTNGGIYVFTPVAGPPVQNTPVGTDVEVVAIYPETGDPSPVTVSFENVTTAGDTTVTTVTGPPPEGALRLFPPNTYYDVVTTATYEGTITIAIYYGWTDLSPGQERNLRLKHFENGVWVDITTLVS